MLSPSLLISLILIIAGLFTYFLAPKIGPNQWFGVRFSYTMLDRKVWDRSNRLGGLLFIAVGIVLALLALFFPPEWQPSIPLLAVALVLAVVFLTYLEAKKMAEGYLPKEKGPSEQGNRWKKAYLIFVGILTLTLLVISLVYYSRLPQLMATHFNSSGQGNDQMLKPLALFFPLGLQVILAVLFAFLYQDQLNSTASIKSTQVLLGVAFSVHLVITFVSLDIIFYNLLHRHLFEIQWLFFLLPILVVFPPLFFYWLARRQETFIKK